MADEVEKQEQTEQTGNAGSTGDGASQAGKSYSQDDLNRMFAERAKQAESALLKQLGFESKAAAEALIRESKARKEAEMSELQKAQERAAELEKQLLQAAEAQKAMAMQADITAKAASWVSLILTPLTGCSIKGRSNTAMKASQRTPKRCW